MKLRWLWGLAIIILFALPSRASAPAGRYTISAGVVTDTKTGLVWQQSHPSNSGIKWDAAKTYCSNLNLNGTGWRLPTVKELLTIVDETASDPDIDGWAFPGVPSGASMCFWSSSPRVTTSQYAWRVDFVTGFAGMDDVNWFCLVRCVR